jgi:hypothetical protein
VFLSILVLVFFALLAAVKGRRRHTKRDWLLALSALAYSPALVALGVIADYETGTELTFWREHALVIVVHVLVVHCAVAIWLAKSRLLLLAIAPLALWLGVFSAIFSQMSLTDSSF